MASNFGIGMGHQQQNHAQQASGQNACCPLNLVPRLSHIVVESNVNPGRHNYHDCEFYYSSRGCSQGDLCKFRHERSSRKSKRVCRNWLTGSCTYRTCKFRHAYLESEPQYARWYWLDDEDEFIEYGTCDPITGSAASVDSAYIEACFQQRVRNVDFTVEECEYLLNFEIMMQKSQDSSRRREVERRVEFPCPQALNPPEIPTYWVPMNNNVCLLVSLEKSCKEYRRLETSFHRTVPESEHVITSIKRIQNPCLWKCYNSRKSMMLTMFNNDVSKINERWLFHGTASTNITSISTDNLSYRMAGQNGVNFGTGVYFSSTAKYSVKFCTTQPRTMLVSYVLIGSYTEGAKGMLKPPTDPQTGSSYDTTVDDCDDPSIFVKYSDHAHYPAYVIEFK